MDNFDQLLQQLRAEYARSTGEVTLLRSAVPGSAASSGARFFERGPLCAVSPEEPALAVPSRPTSSSCLRKAAAPKALDAPAPPASAAFVGSDREQKDVVPTLPGEVDSPSPPSLPRSIVLADPDTKDAPAPGETQVVQLPLTLPRIDSIKDSKLVLRKSWLEPPLIAAKGTMTGGRGSLTRGVSTPNAAVTAASEESGPDEIEVQEYNGFLKVVIGRPSSPLRLAWDVAGAFLIFYDLFVIPLGAFDLPESGFLLGMGWVTLIFWTLNVLGSLTTGYVQDGKTVMDPSLIAKTYFKTWFIIDLVVVVPDWIFTMMPAPEEVEGQESASGGPGDQLQLLRMLRLVRMTRLLRLLKLKKLGELINDNIDSEYLAIVASITKMIMLLIIINHVLACIWWAVGSSGSGSDTWIVAHEFNEVNLGYQYATSFHWSITQFTPSSMSVQPQNVLERFFAIAVVVFALVGFSYVVGSITGSLTQLRGMQEEASKQFWNLRKYLKQHDVPADLRTRIQRYLEHAWARKASTPAKIKIFDLLSEQLMSELKFELSERYLLIHPLFKQLNWSSPVSMQRLANSAINQKQVARGDQLFQANEVAKELYIVVRGRFSYFQASKADPVQEILKGFQEPVRVDEGEDWISEPVLWLQTWIHKGVLEAYLDSELMLVNPDKFVSVMQQNPDSLILTMKYAQNFCEWIGKEDPNAISDIFQGGETEDAAPRAILFMELEENVIDDPVDDAGRQAGPFGLAGRLKRRMSMKVDP